MCGAFGYMDKLTKLADELFKDAHKAQKRGCSIKLPSKCERDFGEVTKVESIGMIVVVVLCPFVLYVVLTLLLT